MPSLDKQLEGFWQSRRTIGKDLELSGIGLFTQEDCTVRILPSDQPGLRFVRTDVAGAPRREIALPPSGVVQQARHTVLEQCNALQGNGAHPRDGVGQARITIATTEHILSALVGLGVTDAIIEVHGPEVPIVDGSALPFSNLEVCEVSKSKGRGPTPKLQLFQIPHEIVIRAPKGDAWIRATPPIADDARHASPPALHLEYFLDYGSGPGRENQVAEILQSQRAKFSHYYDGSSAREYLARIAPARTFCTQSEAEQFQKLGMFARVDLQSVLVIGPGGPINTTLRLPDEPAAHKVLDMLGDLAIAGVGIVGAISAFKAGHALNQQMALELAKLHAENK